VAVPQHRSGREASIALVVDPFGADVVRLGELLEHYGLEVVTAHTGEEAVSVFTTRPVAAVFCELDLPDMNGLALIQRLTELRGRRFVPIVVATHVEDARQLALCIDAGAEAVLEKPYNPHVLSPRIKAWARLLELYAELEDRNAELQAVHNRNRWEAATAERVLSHAVTGLNEELDGVRSVRYPAETFCGDLVLQRCLPDGRRWILVGDFTGHGLAAALAAFPVSEVFHAIAGKGGVERLLLREINNKLYRLLPADMFMAGLLVSIDPTGCHAKVWNAGMPDAIITGHMEPIRLPSTYVPLGVMPDLRFGERYYGVELDATRSLFVCSDGLLESRDRYGRSFELRQFEPLLAGANARLGFEDMDGRVQAWLHGGRPEDDVTLVEIAGGIASACLPAEGERRDPDWSWNWRCQGLALRVADPVGVVGQQLGLLELPEGLRKAALIVFGELWLNALEHGVLGLKSEWKDAPDGFLRYYAERERLLADRVQGQVSVELSGGCDEDGCWMEIVVEDSGPGFDYRKLQREFPPDGRPYGRGLPLVFGHSTRVSFDDAGRRVQVLLRGAEHDAECHLAAEESDAVTV
jgi:CheY-like chemotaxis protein